LSIFSILNKDNEWEKFQNKKYEVELECAIQMSLSLEEEKRRLKELEEEELRVIFNLIHIKKYYFL